MRANDTRGRTHATPMAGDSLALRAALFLAPKVYKISIDAGKYCARVVRQGLSTP